MTLCCYEGYIRNRRQLCRELGLGDDASERAVLEAGYRRWGSGLVARLYGGFAFAFRDGEGAVFCARDQIGLQPLFYCLAGDRELLLGCDINDILRDPRYHRAIDREALQYYMGFGYPVGEKTLWRGIRKLMPGQTLAFRNGEIRLSSYYKPVYAPDHARTEEAWTEEIEDTLRAVLREDRENTRCDAVCSFLSGGVDSSYLLALSGIDRAVGIGYVGEAASEAPLAARTAEYLGAGFAEADIAPEDFFDAVPRAVRRTGLPLADASAIAFGIGCERVARDSTACYSGEGADEFFAGYQIYRRAGELAQTGGPLHYGCAGVMEAADAARLIGLERPFGCEHLVWDLYADSESDEHLARLLRIDCALWLEGDILFGVKSSARSCGLKLLLPYADRRVFELAARIPSALKWRDGVDKYILRRAAEKRLPREVAFRQKIGFSVPIRSWLRRDPFRARVEAVLFAPESSGFFDQSLLRQYWTAFQEGNDAVWQVVYAAFVFLIWAREYGIG